MDFTFNDRGPVHGYLQHYQISDQSEVTLKLCQRLRPEKEIWKNRSLETSVHNRVDI